MFGGYQGEIPSVCLCVCRMTDPSSKASPKGQPEQSEAQPKWTEDQIEGCKGTLKGTYGQLGSEGFEG